ncbi:MAG: dethiobiotin synthase [Burkholderiales bacterium]|nr:dethiobiotin synthase [Burkholderiales bacterium]
MRRADLLVIGTDTGVGKTLVAAALLAGLAAAGLRCVGMKPVAAGLMRRGDAWVSEDAEALMRAASVQAPRALVNPYALREAAAPDLAARREGARIALARIMRAFAELRAMSDAVVVEGAGGFRVPLGDGLDGGDLAQALNVPVVLVVGMRLGCINHALLTAEAVAARGLTLAGWVANRIDATMAHFEQNVETLQARLDARRLGIVPNLAQPRFETMAPMLDVRALLDTIAPA